MVRNLLVAVSCASFSLALLASTDVGNSPTRSEVAKIQLAQAGGNWCKKGKRWDQRQHDCVPA